MTDLLKTAAPALCSGAIQAVLFNPYDRALYVRVQQKRKHFLDRRNFQAPFQGFANAAAYRTISSASYIFWQDTCRYWIEEIGGGAAKNQFTSANYPVAYSAVIGVVSGAANGLALNNMQAIKFTMWSQSSQIVDHWETKKDASIAKKLEMGNVKATVAGTNSAAEKGFFTTAAEMYRQGGAGIFFRGVKVTICRDTVFGLVYELLRNSKIIRSSLQKTVHTGAQLKARIQNDSDGYHRWLAKHNKKMAKQDQNGLAFVQNVFAACSGCIASSPINYLRSLAYGTPYGAQVLPLKTLYTFHLREVQYVFRNGHTFTDVVKFKRIQDVSFCDAHRIEAARSGLGLRPLYMADTAEGGCAPTQKGNGFLRRFLRQPRWCQPIGHRMHFWAAANHINRRLNIGWGSLRVGLGMAVGQHVFAMAKEAMDVK